MKRICFYAALLLIFCAGQTAMSQHCFFCLDGSWPAEGGNLTISTNGPLDMTGVWFWAAEGILTPGTNPDPFDTFVASPQNPMTLAGVPVVTLDGSYELDVAVAPGTIEGDIFAEWGWPGGISEFHVAPAVPEPSGWLHALFGFAGTILLGRKRRRVRA